MRHIINWNRKWAFTKNADAVPEVMPERWDYVNVPHTWNGIDGQDGGDDYYRGTCYYAKELVRADLPEADRYYLQFEGTNASASLYIDGKLITSHDGGYSTWRADITDCIGEKSLVVVAVDNSPSRTVYPQNADFTFYGGMYRDVSIIAVCDTHFDLDSYGGCGLAVTPAVLEDGSADIRIVKEFADHQCPGHGAEHITDHDHQHCTHKLFSLQKFYHKPWRRDILCE